MTSRTRVADAARATARRIGIELGREVHEARLSSALSQREAAARVEMSHSQFGRIERAEIDDLTIEQAARACAAVGLRLFARALTGDDPALDSGQLALLARFRRRLPASIAVPTEVPLPIVGDRRAWDALIRVEGVDIGIEAEARIRDAQAVDRKCGLKKRDGRVAIVILLVADTVSNRRMLALHREALRPSFPLDTREVLSKLGMGQAPAASGIVVL